MEPFEEENQNEVQMEKTNPLAIAGMVVGITSMFMYLLGIMGIVAIILSSVALAQIKARGQKGRGMAIAGLILGIIGMVLGLLAFMFLVSFFKELS